MNDSISEPLPVSSVTTIYIGQENVELQWVAPPATTGFDGFHILVIANVRFVEDQGPRQISKGATTTEITGLSPGVSYTVKISTTSNNQSSVPKEFTFETCKLH